MVCRVGSALSVNVGFYTLYTSSPAIFFVNNKKNYYFSFGKFESPPLSPSLFFAFLFFVYIQRLYAFPIQIFKQADYIMLSIYFGKYVDLYNGKCGIVISQPGKYLHTKAKFFTI